MSVTISSVRATRIDWTGNDLTVEFMGTQFNSATVYYKYDSSVSSSANDGSLTAAQSVTLTGTAWFRCATAADGSTGFAVLDVKDAPETAAQVSLPFVNAADHGFAPTATAAQNNTAMQAAIDAGKGGTVKFPAGNYLMPATNWVVMNDASYSNTTLDFTGAFLDFSASPPGGFTNCVRSAGTEVARDATGWQFLTAYAAEGAQSITVADGSQFAQWDWVKIGSEDRWDTNQRNQKVGEIAQITSVSGNTLSFSSGIAGEYFPYKRETTTPTTCGALDAAQTSIPVGSTDSYRMPQQNLPGIVKIDTEEITYTAKTDATFEGCTRGANGTTAATHLNGATVNEVANFSTLTAGITAADGTIPVASTTGAPSSTSGYIYIGSELIFYSGFTGTSYTGCVRGRGGTTAAIGNSGDRVYFAHGAHVAKLTMIENVTILGGHFYGPNLTSSDSNFYKGFSIEKHVNFRAVGNVFERAKERSIDLVDCVRAEITDMHSFWSDRNNLGYGVAYNNACQDCITKGCRFVKPRHGITHGGTFTTYGVPRRIHHENNVCYDSLNQSYDIHSSGGEDITFINCHAFNPADAGFWVANASVDIIGCSVIGTSSTGVFGIIQNERPVRIRVQGCNFRGASSGYGIYFSQESVAGRPSSMSRVDWIQITGNNVQDSFDSGIKVEGTGGFTTLSQPLTNVVVANNNVDRITRNFPQNSYYLSRLLGASISGNVATRGGNQAFYVRNVDCSALTGNVVQFRKAGTNIGFDVDSADDTTLTGNVVNNGTNGILLGASCTNCTVIGNSLRNCTTPLTMGAGTGHISKTSDGATAGFYNRT